jgi:CheY-like chemotaxis protein
MAAPVLVVDDNPRIRKLLCTVLTMEGYTVIQTVEHGGPALDILRASREGLVVLLGLLGLLGLLMPCVDGEDVLEAVASDEVLTAHHAFVMVTASARRASTGRVAELRERLGVPLIEKPFTIYQILDAVEEASARLTQR